MPTTPTASARSAKGGGVASNRRRTPLAATVAVASNHASTAPATRTVRRRRTVASSPRPVAPRDESGCDEERQDDEPRGDYLALGPAVAMQL
jgi:hypothetical protein